MMFNVASMWSKCLGSLIPPEIQHLSQKVEGKLLSQEDEFYGSERVGKLVDTVMRMVLGEKDDENQG